MKVTVVPAQITSVEDRIAGSLGLSQLLLLSVPIFGGSIVFVVLPPIFHAAAYKLVTIGVIAIICSLLSIRIKGKIVLFWLAVLMRYNLRPRYYLFDKRSRHGREQYLNLSITDPEDEPVVANHNVRQASSLSPAEVIALNKVIENPATNLSFITNKKGRLYVRITEIEPQV